MKQEKKTIVSDRQLKTPCYVIDSDKLEANLKILQKVMDETGCRILLAQKAFSSYALYPLISKYLCGMTASGLFEARLCHEEAPEVENHIYCPAFREEDMEEILEICDHIVFNSPRQLSLFGKRAKDAGLQVGLRVNPEKSTQEGHAIYDPCAPGSRLGTTLADFEAAIKRDPSLLAILDGLHFHTLCEQDSDALKLTLVAVEEKFGRYLKQMKWINFGGGHHITREDYHLDCLKECILHMQNEYGLTVYLEPGEAIALDAGYLYATVLEVKEDESQCAICSAKEAGVLHKRVEKNVILDTSAACHMPDVLEMPYRPGIRESGEAFEKSYTYRLGGPTCLAGDTIGIYSFDQKLKEGDRLLFEDMAIYSMVKNNTFNGMPLPNIYIKQADNYQFWKEFGYEDFKQRL